MPAELWSTLPLGGGLHGKPGVKLTDAMRNYLKVVVARTDMDIVVTSGRRTAIEQANAWAAKIRLGYDQEDFRRLYKRDDLVDEVYVKSDLTVLKMAEVFQKQMDRGDYLSSHMSGLALDIRIHGYSEDELEKLEDVLVSCGGRVVKEARPPHWHVEIRSTVTDRRDTPTRSTRTVRGPRRRSNNGG